MRIAVDTNVLVRAALRDDAEQAQAAEKVLSSATLVAVALPCLCEFVWMLRRLYGIGDADIASAVRALIDTANVEANRPAVEAGLSALEAGGDFADGVIAFEGRALGAQEFVSFDRKTIAMLAAQGHAARLP